MKRRGFSHADRVAGGKARAAAGRRDPLGRFVRRFDTAGQPKPSRRHKTTIHVEHAELERLAAERGLRRTPTRVRAPRFVLGRRRVFPRRFEVHVQKKRVPNTTTKRYNPKMRGLGGF